MAVSVTFVTGLKPALQRELVDAVKEEQRSGNPMAIGGLLNARKVAEMTCSGLAHLWVSKKLRHLGPHAGRRAVRPRRQQHHALHDGERWWIMGWMFDESDR